MVYDVDRENISLDAERLKENKKTYALALVVSEEVEALRLARGERVTTYKNNLAQLLRDPDSLVAANPNPWYTFVTDMDLPNRCAFRLGLSRTQTIERICKELLPPNWETLFWMHACLENLRKNAKELVLLERQIHEAEKFAISGAAKKAAGDSFPKLGHFGTRSR